MGRRKHLELGLAELPALHENHEVVRALGPPGNGLVDVERADGTCTLCLMPKKFHQSLWIKRGGFLLIEMAASDAGRSNTPHAQGAMGQPQEVAGSHVQGTTSGGGRASSSNVEPRAGKHEGGVPKVTGTIVAVLYAEQIRELKKTGAWPAAFNGEQPPLEKLSTEPPRGDQVDEDENEDEGLPPLEPNRNRRVVVYSSDDEEEEEDG